MANHVFEVLAVVSMLGVRLVIVVTKAWGISLISIVCPRAEGIHIR